MTASTEHLSEQELSAQLEKAHQRVKVGALYAHYRDLKNPYRVVGLGIIEATEEVGVIYQKDVGSKITWVRPLNSWIEKVSFENQMVPRFQKVETV
jgi:hypothetical protein